MRVVVREAFRAYINMQPEDFTAGQKIKGDTAVRLLRSNAAVDPDDDAAHELAAALRGDDDQEQRGEKDVGPQQETETPPTGRGAPDAPPAQAAGGDLDISASVADVLAWVGDDSGRAAEALRQEQEKDTPRSTLVKQLQKTADA